MQINNMGNQEVYSIDVSANLSPHTNKNEALS